MNIAVETITPERAAEMLQKNTHNRPLAPKTVNRYAREMVAGHWQLNGDPIRFNGTQLLDGQHRLAAVVKSGVAIETVVIEGLPTETFSTIDCGKLRSAADALALRGEINSRNLQSAVRWIDRYKTGRMMLNSAPDYTITDILDLVDNHPGVRRSVMTVKNHTRNLIAPSVLSACHYLFSEFDGDAADEFVQRLKVGANLTLQDPIFLLRERLVDNAMSKAKLNNRYLMALTIKAWNAQRGGQPLKFLRFREDGPVPEQFPQVK